MNEPNWPLAPPAVRCPRCEMVQPWERPGHYAPNCVHCGFYPGPKR